MPRVGFKSPSVNRSVIDSEMVRNEVSLLPGREDLVSNDEVVECDGGVARRNTIAVEVLSRHIQVLDGDNSSAAMDVGLSYPTWIAEIPEPMVSCTAEDGGEAPIRPVEAYSRFDSDTSTNDSTAYGLGGLYPVVKEMELDVEELPCEPTMQSKNLSVELSSPLDTGVDKDFEKMKSFVLRQNFAREKKARLDMEAIHQLRGSTSVASTSMKDNLLAVTTPPRQASTAPLERVKVEELQIEKCPGLREVHPTKKQPLIIIAVNVMQPDGPVLSRFKEKFLSEDTCPTERTTASSGKGTSSPRRFNYKPVNMLYCLHSSDYEA